MCRLSIVGTICCIPTLTSEYRIKYYETDPHSIHLPLVLQNMGHLSCICNILIALIGGDVSGVESIQILSVTGAARRIGFQRQSMARHTHINPFSSLAHNRISFISSYGKPHMQRASYVRRDVSLVNIVKETENGDNDIIEADAIRTFGSSSKSDIEEEEYLDDDVTSDDGENLPNEPICRVVATSDGKIPHLATYSSLSVSSQTLVQQLELLYAAQSQKKLRDLRQLPSSGAMNDGYQSEQESLSMDQKLVSTIKQSLEDGGFRLMDQRDLDLCSALNAGYLLRLSLRPDFKDLDPTIGQQFYPELYSNSNGNIGEEPVPKNPLLFDGRVLVFRRGYSQEVTTGRLLLPKLDYLQASLVQRSSASLTRTLGILEQKLEDVISELLNLILFTMRKWQLRLLAMFQSTILEILKSSGLLGNKSVSRFISDIEFFGIDFIDCIESRPKDDNQTSQSFSLNDKMKTRGNKIFRLRRYGLGEKYSTFNVIANSLDLSDALSPFSLCEVSSNDTSSVEQDMYQGIDEGKLKCQYDEIYDRSPQQPATVRLLERVSIQNTVNFFSEVGRRDLIKNYFKRSTLKEPSYEEVVVIWRPQNPTKSMKTLLSQFATLPKWFYDTAKIFDLDHKLPKQETDRPATEEKEEIPVPLEIKAFNDVPMANILAVLPKTKLVFRPADAFVLDMVSIVSFIALGASLKFDNPRLDLLAVVSLSLFAVRTFFRYSNKYARYDLLVNKFLTKKQTHRGSGALSYIVSQADSQKALMSGLIRDWLNESEVCVSTSDSRDNSSDLTLDYDILDHGKSFINDRASANDTRIDIDIILSAVEELNSLDLLDVTDEDRSLRFKDDKSTKENIQRLWNDVLPV